MHANILFLAVASKNSRESARSLRKSEPVFCLEGCRTRRGGPISGYHRGQAVWFRENRSLSSRSCPFQLDRVFRPEINESNYPRATRRLSVLRYRRFV